MAKVLKRIGQKNNNMNIAIITAGVLPVPAVKGGAVENLIDFCLEYNAKLHLHNITVYSVYNTSLRNYKFSDTTCNKYIFFNTQSWWGIFKKKIYLYKHGGQEYYHYSIEYFLEKAINHIKRLGYDIVIVENRPAFSLKLQKNTRAKLVLHQENDFLNNQVHKYKDIYDSYSLIINTSSYVTERVKLINPKDTKCRTVLNGIDINRFYQANHLSRNHIGLNDDDFIIVYSGRLTEEKGILELILAIKQLEYIHNLKLLIIGASAYGQDKHPTKYIEQLEKESEQIKEKVIFTGYIDYQQMPSYLKMADIAVVPSMWEEPFGLTVVEAMAAGLPLITTRSGGIPEICEGVATIVDRDNIVNNLTNAILELYNNPEKRKQMATASIERSKLFDKETYAKNFFAALESIDYNH